jgi:CYTH domain-containing protein
LKIQISYFCSALQEIKKIIAGFPPISLSDMDSVELLNRTDTKFIMERHTLGKVLMDVADEYQILDIDGTRLNRYRTLYYDTPELRFYLQHQNGKKNRYKVRYRKYVDSDLCFLEVKFKSNKGRTVKKRVKTDDFELNLENESSKFVTKTTGLENKLVPTLWNTFKRMTLVNKEIEERVTIDLDLTYEMEEESLHLKNLVIVEVKQNRQSRHSPFVTALKEHYVRPERISKYCMGIALLCEDAKKNQFKRKLLMIEKLENGIAV